MSMSNVSDERQLARLPTIRDELRQLTPSNSELLKLAERFPAPQEWYDEASEVEPVQGEVE